MDMTHPDAGFRSGYVAIVGRPNVGKSTLLNRFIGQKLAAVTPKPQTTRQRVMGIWTTDSHQVIFFDTPGLLAPRTQLHRSMIRAAQSAIVEADILLALHDVTEPVERFDEILVETKRRRGALIVALNKIDLIAKELLLPMIARVHDSAAGVDIVPISALTGDNVDRLVECLTALLPAGPPLYAPDIVTEQPERFFVAEIVREQILLTFREEVPHAVQVQVERFEEIPGKRDEIDAVICVERPTQKAILVGTAGQAIKALGIASRRAIEEFLGRPVVLKLFVKVVPGWRQDPRALRRLGFES